MKNRNRSIVALTLLLVAPIASSMISGAAEPRYRLIDLGSLPDGQQFNDSFTGVNGRLINNSSTVVGGMDTGEADPFGWQGNGITSHAFEWKDGALTDLAPNAFDNTANFSQAFWINDSGHSVGIATYNASDPSGPLLKAIMWKDGQMVDLGALGGNQSYAHAINNHDQVVGWALDTVAAESIWATDYPFPFATRQRAAFWGISGAAQDLGDLGGPSAWAMGINDNGQIIGQSFTAVATGTPHAIDDLHWVRPVMGFIWHDGTMTSLGNLGGTMVLPLRMNQAGQVIGFATRTGDTIHHPFFWAKGTIKDLGTLGGSNGKAIDINDAGEIVGGTDLANGGRHAFFWKDGVMKDLGSVRQRSYAWYINSKSQVVGITWNPGSPNRAFLWENGGPMIDLNTVLVGNDSSMTLLYPVGINDVGEIAGYGALENGDSHPFLLVPLPKIAVRASTTAGGQRSITLDLQVNVGRKYVLESSNDLLAWSPLGDAFVAQEDNLTRELELLEAHLFFRIARAF